MQTLRASPQETDAVHIDLFQMMDGPVRLRDAATLSAVLLGGLLGTAFFWQFRSRWIRMPSRILGGIIAILEVLFANYIRRCGIGWPSEDFSGEPTWVFSRSADHCFLFALLLLTIVGLILVSILVRKVLPNSVLQPFAQTVRNS